MNRILLFLLAAVLFVSCNPVSDHYSKFLNQSGLTDQRFTIQNDRDTVLRTKGGVQLRIAKGSFNKEQVQLLVLEALTPADIVRAGLRTETTDGKMLSSGGMIRLSAPGQDVQFQKAIAVSMPTHQYDPAMQLFKGEEEDGKVLWKDPEPLPESDTVKMGKQLFQQICASCHQLDKAMTGPALRGFRQRGPWMNQLEVYKFIHNPGAYMGCNSYARGLQQQYGAIMSAFPQLTPAQIDAITQYVDRDFHPDASLPAAEAIACFDSCTVYRQALAELEWLKNEKDRGMGRVERINADVDYIIDTTAPVGTVDTTGGIEMVGPESYQAQAYQFTVAAFGWYNIDHLLAVENASGSYLSVAVDGAPSGEYNVFLVVPQYNIFGEGGKLDGKKDRYGFFTKDGKIPLPLGTAAYVFAISEKDGKILFGSQGFMTSSRNEIRLSLKEMNKSEFDAEMQLLNTAKLTIRADKLPAEEPGETQERDLHSLEMRIDHLKPVKCDCGCDPRPAPDSVSDALVPITEP